MIYCNDCKKPVHFIESRKSGSVKCEPTPEVAYTITGRKMEVYLLHECDYNGKTPDEISKIKAEKGSFWVNTAKD
jgi:hypothetical protein